MLSGVQKKAQIFGEQSSREMYSMLKTVTEKTSITSNTSSAGLPDKKLDGVQASESRMNASVDTSMVAITMSEIVLAVCAGHGPSV